MLIAEDEEFNYLFLRDSLKPYGTCQRGVNGEEAFDFFLMGHQENSPYDLIFLDIIMPVLDGHETLKKIRTWEKTNLPDKEAVPIIMVTSQSHTDTIIATFQDGAQRYLIKPFEQQDLEELMEEMGYSKIQE